MSKGFSAIGIVLVLFGTVLSLWSILGTDPRDVRKAGYLDTQSERFKKDKTKVIIGIIFIVAGSISQIIGLFL